MAYVIEIQIRFRDTDGMGHVNNAVFMSYCETARLEFYRKHHPNLRGPHDIPFILASTRIDYRRPLELDQDRIEVELTVPRIGTTSWDFAYDIRPPGGGKAFAEAVTVMVAYDYKQATKIPISDEYRAILESIAP